LQSGALNHWQGWILIPLAGLLAVASGGCISPTAPTARWHQTVPSWSPYVVVHPNDGALRGYQEALDALASHDAVLGVRIPLFLDGSSAPTVRLAQSLGLDVVGVMDDADLGKPDVAQVFDQYFAAYPDVQVFQVGNEITTRQDAAAMSFDRYLDVLQQIAAHVRAYFPGVQLVSQAEFGAGTLGGQELAQLAARLPAMGVSPRDLIIGVNVYTDMALTADAAVLATALSGYRVWVTETGIADSSQELSYVSQKYPLLRTALHAERIYWYALWAGDSGGDSGYSLVHAPVDPPIVPGPLFQALTE
jgi:hypothetical protein